VDNCAKCGKELSWRERQYYWQRQLRHGYLEYRTFSGKVKRTCPEYKDKKLCKSCMLTLLNIGDVGASPAVKLNEEVNKAILWQKNEVLVGHIGCQEFFEDRTQTLGVRLGHHGFLIVTNQRVLFACKLGFMAKDYGIMFGINLENIVSVSPGKFGFNDKLVILDKNGQHRDFIKPKIHSLVPIINEAISERRNQLEAQKERERVQIVLDFSSLKDIMAKGGIVMSAYNCPKCNAMVDIPEAGKIMFCKYCGTPIKPVDIFDRIKSLL